jgi:hypothetical protein
MRIHAATARIAALLSACGGLTPLASAQPYLINLTGSVFYETFVRAPESTQDAIDLNANGMLCDQLDPALPSNPPSALQWWHVQARFFSNDWQGLQELQDFGLTFANGADAGITPQGGSPAAPNNPPNGLSSDLCLTAYISRQQFIANGDPGGSATSFFNANNPGGFPCRSNTSNYIRTFSPPGPATGGVQIDAALLPTPAIHLSRFPGAPGFDHAPLTAGFGSNPRTAVSKTGAALPTQSNRQPILLTTLNYDYASPNASTIYETLAFWRPIAVMMNLGLGRTGFDVSELRYLAATGRSTTGENLMFITNQSGTASRTGLGVSIGVDPSYCVGENVGLAANTSNQNLLGPNFIPSNKIGESSLETTVINHRLALAPVFAERGVVGGTWLTGGRAEVAAVRADTTGGTTFARPTIDRVLDNGLVGQIDPSTGIPYTQDGYRLGTFASIATIGDPRSAPVNFGGDSFNANPDMRNVHAASYINNLTRLPGPSPITPPPLCPSPFAASLGLKTLNSLDYIPSLMISPPTFAISPLLIQDFQNYIRTTSVLSNPAYATFGTVTLNGRVPTRQTGTTYSDGIANGTAYLREGGGTVAYGSALTNRNRVAGDFNGDGLRDVNDAFEMIAAWRKRYEAAPWVAPSGIYGPGAGNDAIIEVLGDFNGDGTFNKEDIRYWCDGLAIDPGTGLLDRNLGFTAVDNAYFALTGNNNFFGTVPPIPVYLPGMSRFDIAGGPGLTPGFAPIGANGIINTVDFNYVIAQRTAPCISGPTADWQNLSEAVCFDLSADVSGSLVVLARDRRGGAALNALNVDAYDIRDVLSNAFMTTYGDANLDGVVDAVDEAIVLANQGTGTGWGQGDVNGDGIVDATDLQVVRRYRCSGDANIDGTINFGDITVVLSTFGTQYDPDPAGQGDANADGFVNFSDITTVLSSFGSNCP